MKQKAIRISTLIMAALMCLTFSACGDTDQGESLQPAEQEVLRVGYEALEGVFNPFYAVTEADKDVCALTGVSLLEYDRGGGIVTDGNTVNYKGKGYTYDGIAACETVTAADGRVTYNITLREDVYFSDSEQLTADDVIFTMYVLADPAYDGPSTFSSLPIVGMTDYRAGMFVLSEMIADAGDSNRDFTYWTEEQQNAYWSTLKGEAGERFAQDIVDYCIENGFATDVVSAMKKWGYGHAVEDGKEYTASDFFDIMRREYKFDYKLLDAEEAAGESLFDITEELLEDTAPELGRAVMISESEPTVRGIEKTGEFSLRVTTERFDAGVLYALTMTVAPLHYYGDEGLFAPERGTFGFVKGDLAAVKAKSEPMGAGPYVFSSYDGGRVNFTANSGYYKGEIKTPELTLIGYADSGQMTSALIDGNIDICAPELSDGITEAVKEANGADALTGEAITCLPVDFNGYGFIGINANNVSVGNTPGGKASKNLRKAFAVLFAAYREESVSGYYGEMAEVIEYPISSVSWAAPVPTDRTYSTAYSKGVYGAPIYTPDMTDEARYQVALDTAKEFLLAAGYSWSNSQGRFYSAPNGARMSYTVIVPGGGAGDHPCYELVTKVSEALESIGIDLTVDDVTDNNRLWTALNSGSADMWCAAWTGSADPDLYKVYYSANYPTNVDGTGKNHFYIADGELDGKILSARTMADDGERRRVYHECLSIIMDWAVEVPVYQRKQMYLYSTERVDVDTLPTEMTTYRRWISGVESIEMK